MKFKNNKLLYIALFFVNVIWMCIFLQMTPLGDDWYYVTTPRGGTLDLARPIDELIGVILKMFPFLFPWFNRLLLMVLHFINCIIFHKFAVNILKKKQYTTIFTLLFSVSPWIYAAIAQTDSINQVIMFTLGMAGTYLYFKIDNEVPANVCYILFTALSLCAKESGVAFLAVIPAIILIKVIHSELELKAAVQRMFRSYLFGIVLFAVYFIAFFVLQPYVALEQESQTFKGLFAKITFPIAAFTGVNTFDVYNSFWLTVVSELVLSVPLVLYAFASFVKLAKNKNKLAFVAPMLFIFGEIFILPVQLFYCITDMHMYPFVFFALLIILYYLPENRKRLINILFVGYFISFIISDVEKIYWQNVSSDYVRRFQTEVSKLIDENPVKIYTIFPSFTIVDEKITYHAIADDWCSANCYGKSLHSVYGYDVPILFSIYYSVEDIERLMESVSDDYTFLVVYPDKSLKLIE